MAWGLLCLQKDISLCLGPRPVPHLKKQKHIHEIYIKNLLKDNRLYQISNLNFYRYMGDIDGE